MSVQNTHDEHAKIVDKICNDVELVRVNSHRLAEDGSFVRQKGMVRNH